MKPQANTGIADPDDWRQRIRRALDELRALESGAMRRWASTSAAQSSSDSE
jgi:hypothetical protein